jgi:hypothetical protein
MTSSHPSFRELLGKKALIIGDIGTGKTELTRRLLEEAIDLGYSEEITIIDMAPERVVIDGMPFGGRLFRATERHRGVRYLVPPRVETPRLKATSAEELRSLVLLNAERIRPLLEEYLASPTPILFINDASIYLQGGSLHPLLEAVERAETLIANGYYGECLSEDLGTGVSSVERRLMERLASYMDVVISL